jgi:2-succinyl-6-hydroxy-2,4-cyclohexadiene-1-carboxylate synthase
MLLNGLEFNVEVDGVGRPLLLLHGFTGSCRNWDEIRPSLRRLARVITIDLIGHGRSAAPSDPARYTLDCASRDLVALLDNLQLSKASVVGYSMGGRVALRLAVDAPDRVETLILESASPGIADTSERANRLESDTQLAERILAQGVAAFVQTWETQPLLQPAQHVSLERRRRQHALRLANSPRGLANSLLGMGAGRQTPLWDRLPALAMPLHLIVGRNDARYVEIARRMASLLPHAFLHEVEEAGHTVHLDAPEEFARIVTSALNTA